MIFGLVGLGQEVLFTSLWQVWYALTTSDIHAEAKLLYGFSSLWYFPMYCLVPIILHRFYQLFAVMYAKETYCNNESVLAAITFQIQIPIYVRGLIYAVLFHIFEYLFMSCIKMINHKTPSEDSYSTSALSLHNMTRLDYVIPFAASGILFEQVYLQLY